MLEALMRPKTWAWIIAILIAIIVLFIGFLTGTKAPEAQTAPPPSPATSTAKPTPKPQSSPAPTPESKAPLSSKVTITSPEANATVSHSLSVTGKAPGPWFFEAQFPIQVRDNKGNVIGSSPAQAEGDWMTNSLVPFKATIALDPSYHGIAKLILLKDNPSGLPENDDSVTIQIAVE